MIKLSFPTIILKNYIERENKRVKDYENPTLKVYGVSNKYGVCITGKKISENLNNYIVIEENYFVYNPYRINVGSIGLVPKGIKGIVSPAYVVFKSKGQINNKLLLQYLKSSVGISLIKWYGNKGGVRDALRYSDLEKIDFPDITKLNQDKIINKLSKLEIINSELIKDIDSQNEYISYLRQSILQEAVQGKLTADWRKQNPDVEPASELLKRIKAEKEKLIKEEKIKKQKPLLPITQDEIPFELPDGWVWCRLGKICVVNPRNNKKDDLDCSFIPMRLISDKYGVIPDFEIKKWFEIKSGFTHFADNDIVIAKITPCFENSKAAIMKNLKNCFGAGTTELHILRAILIIPDFIYIVSKTSEFLKEGQKQMTGTAGQKRVPKSFIENYSIALPPLPEQQQIVKKVDKLMQLCDELEENVKKAKEYSEQLMEAVLREAFD